MTIPPIIETEDITKVFGKGAASVTALDRISLRIDSGDFVAITGPSGSGKSTLMHILGCLSRPSSGHYVFDGRDVSNLDNRALALMRNQKIGFVFQAYNLLPRTTALRNVMLPLLYDRRQDALRIPQEKEALAGEVLAQVGLSDRSHHQPQELSGGQQQRVAIARALVNKPMLIIADEPTGNIDSHAGEEIMGLLHAVHRQGATIVIVTHDPRIAAHTQRTVEMRDGRIEKMTHNDQE